MLSVTGNVLIPNTAIITFNKTEYGAFFQTIAVAKHPKKEDVASHLHYKISIFVPPGQVKRAIEKIVPGTMIQIRHGELKSTMREGKDGPIIFNDVSTNWSWIEFLVRYPSKDKQTGD